MKRTCTALCLLLCLLFPLFGMAACGESTAEGVDVPQGMQNATGEEQGYYYFLPEGWAVEHTTGITMATPSAYANTTLSLAVFSSERSVEEYWLQSREETTAKFTDFTMEEEGAETLLGTAGEGGRAARRYTFSGTYYTGTAYRICQFIARANGRIHVLTYTSTTEEYDDYKAQFDTVTQVFVFTEEAASSTTPDVSGTVTDGMRQLSDPDIHAYTFSVPETWIPAMQTGILSAYVSDSDRSSVSFTCLYPEGISTLKDYWEALQPSYQHMYQDYAVQETGITTDAEGNTLTVAGLPAARYTFTGKNGGVEYRVTQYFLIRGSYIYTFTYTAQSAHYEEHLSDVSRILSHITFA